MTNSPPNPRPAPVRHRKANDTATNLGIFAVTFLLSLGGGYMLFNKPQPPAMQPTTAATTPTPATTTPAPVQSAGHDMATMTPAPEAEIFTKRGCVGCHSIAALGVKGGVTGPDLSKAYINVPDKHGMPVESFLKKPNSAVMSSVLGATPLKDDELAQVVAGLKAASEK